MLCAMSMREPRNGDRSPAPTQGNPASAKVNGVLGMGLDDDGGHQRITKGEEFYLVGGSAETHERMQDLVMRMRETLKIQGKKFGDLSRGEFEDLARDSLH